MHARHLKANVQAALSVSNAKGIDPTAAIGPEADSSLSRAVCRKAAVEAVPFARPLPTQSQTSIGRLSAPETCRLFKLGGTL